jgi:hypothetical protein
MENNKRNSRKIYKTKNQKKSKRATYLMSGGAFTINIKTLTGRTLRIPDIRADTTIREIKQMIQNQVGIPFSQQRIIFSGRQLDDTNWINYPVACYGIVKDSTLDLVLRLGTEMVHEHYETIRDIMGRDFPDRTDKELIIDESIKNGRDIFTLGFDFNEVLVKLIETDNDEDRAIQLLTHENAAVNVLESEFWTKRKLWIKIHYPLNEIRTILSSIKRRQEQSRAAASWWWRGSAATEQASELTEVEMRTGFDFELKMREKKSKPLVIPPFIYKDVPIVFDRNYVERYIELIRLARMGPQPVAPAPPAINDPECQICQDATAIYALIPCGHRVFCEDCLANGMQLNTCPTCRTPIQGNLRIY